MHLNWSTIYLIWKVIEGLSDWKRANIIPIYKNKNLGNCRAVSLTTFLGEVVEQVFVEVFSKHMKDKKENGWETPAQIYQV